LLARMQRRTLYSKECSMKFAHAFRYHTQTEVYIFVSFHFHGLEQFNYLPFSVLDAEVEHGGLRQCQNSRDKNKVLILTTKKRVDLNTIYKWPEYPL